MSALLEAGIGGMLLAILSDGVTALLANRVRDWAIDRANVGWGIAFVVAAIVTAAVAMVIPLSKLRTVKDPARERLRRVGAMKVR